MGVGDDLSIAAVAAALPDRAIRSYPALVSTDADAQAWARAGAPSGAVVVADYQAAPRGRAGLVWTIEPGADLAFSLVLRVDLPVEREGWLYTLATTAMVEVRGEAATIQWPDQILHRGGGRAGAVGVTAELGPDGLRWAVVSMLRPATASPRAPTMARLVEALEAKVSEAPDAVLAMQRERCATLGKHVRARMIPLGPAGPAISGRARDLALDGSLVVETVKGSRVAIRPQHLGVLEVDSDQPCAPQAGSEPISGWNHH